MLLANMPVSQFDEEVARRFSTLPDLVEVYHALRYGKIEIEVENGKPKFVWNHRKVLVAEKPLPK